MGFFAFSNGYLSTLTEMKSPQAVDDETKKGTVGGFIGITVSLGLWLGSLIAAGLTPVTKS